MLGWDGFGEEEEEREGGRSCRSMRWRGRLQGGFWCLSGGEERKEGREITFCDQLWRVLRAGGGGAAFEVGRSTNRRGLSAAAFASAAPLPPAPAAPCPRPAPDRHRGDGTSPSGWPDRPFWGRPASHRGPRSFCRAELSKHQGFPPRSITDGIQLVV